MDYITAQAYEGCKKRDFIFQFSVLKLFLSSIEKKFPAYVDNCR